MLVFGISMFKSMPRNGQSYAEIRNIPISRLGIERGSVEQVARPKVEAAPHR